MLLLNAPLPCHDPAMVAARMAIDMQVAVHPIKGFAQPTSVFALKSA